MKALLLPLMLCLAWIPTQAAEFPISAVGFSVSLPQGWHHVITDGPFYILEGPKGRIRAHLYNPDAKTPEEALRFSIASEDRFNAKRPVKTVYLSSKPFVTASRIHGVQATFGAEAAKLPTTIKHFLPNSNGRIVCFCVDHCDQTSFTLIQQALFDSLKQITP